jgi:hypothetical protein
MKTRGNVSHALEDFNCETPFNECPRSKGAFELERAVQNAQEAFIHVKTEANRIKYQEARDKLATYFSQEPLKVIQNCTCCGKDGRTIKVKDWVTDGFQDFCSEKCYKRWSSLQNH